jgi:hypothetical protein
VIGAVAAHQQVIVVAAQEVVVAPTTEELVVAVAAVEVVVTLAAMDFVVAARAPELVVPGLAIDPIAVAAARDEILTAPGHDHVQAVAGPDHVVPLRSYDEVVAVEAPDLPGIKRQVGVEKIVPEGIDEFLLRHGHFLLACDGARPPRRLGTFALIPSTDLQVVRSQCPGVQSLWNLRAGDRMVANIIDAGAVAM